MIGVFELAGKTDVGLSLPRRAPATLVCCYFLVYFATCDIESRSILFISNTSQLCCGVAAEVSKGPSPSVKVVGLIPRPRSGRVYSFAFITQALLLWELSVLMMFNSHLPFVEPIVVINVSKPSR